ncbi:DUF3376 domain-containing protein [Kitasatospora arboriphila]
MGARPHRTRPADDALRPAAPPARLPADRPPPAGLGGRTGLPPLAETRAVATAVRAALREGPPPGPSDAGIADRVSEVFTRLDAARTLGGLVRQAAGSYLTALHTLGDQRFATTRDALACCLAVEVLSHAYAPAAAAVEQPTPAFAFLRLGPDDLGPLFRQDRYADMGDRKLYGTRLGHFGAFLDEDWRSSDFTWGRLDAARHLLRVLVPEPGERQDAERELHSALLAAEIGRERMQQNLDELLGADSALLDRTVGGPGGRDVRQRTARSARALLLAEPEADAAAPPGGRSAAQRPGPRRPRPGAARHRRSPTAPQGGPVAAAPRHPPRPAAVGPGSAAGCAAHRAAS